MENIIVEKSKAFALRIIKLYKYLDANHRIGVISKQILKSGTSIGANIREAFYAHGKADFIAKLQIALKECYETSYWLDIMKDSGFITQECFNELNGDCCKLRRILSASIKTAKNK